MREGPSLSSFLLHSRLRFPSLFHLPSSHFPSSFAFLSLLSSLSIFCYEAAPSNPVRGSGEHCKLPPQGPFLSQSVTWNCICTLVASKYSFWGNRNVIVEATPAKLEHERGAMASPSIRQWMAGVLLNHRSIHKSVQVWKTILQKYKKRQIHTHRKKNKQWYLLRFPFFTFSVILLYCYGSFLLLKRAGQHIISHWLKYHPDSTLA